MESDQQLIDSINKGNADSFEILYYRYRDWAYSLAWRFTGSHQDAQDILQNVFIYLLEKFPGFELTCTMTTFLYPVVKNLSLKLIHSKKRFTSIQNNQIDLPVPEKPDLVGNRAELTEVLAGLSLEHREVLLMRFVDDMKISEIAEALGESISTVKSRLYRALELLRQDSRMKKYFLE
jgi:RNA polymerase sigma-70 factor, ECF subfamily